jgi:hypothetical protein
MHNDYVSNDSDSHKFIFSDVHYKVDNEMPRNNLDPKHAKNSGKLLLDMCKEAGLRNVNGTTIGNIFLKVTCIRYNGCSLVHYTIVSQQLLQQIGHFEVLDFSTLSVVGLLVLHFNPWAEASAGGLLTTGLYPRGLGTYLL